MEWFKNLVKENIFHMRIKRRISTLLTRTTECNPYWHCCSSAEVLCQGAGQEPFSTFLCIQANHKVDLLQVSSSDLSTKGREILTLPFLVLFSNPFSYPFVEGSEDETCSKSNQKEAVNKSYHSVISFSTLVSSVRSFVIPWSTDSLSSIETLNWPKELNCCL